MATKRFANVPADKQAAMERCVLDVKKRSGLPKDRAIAVCYSSVVGGKDLEYLIDKELSLNAKERRKQRRLEDRRLNRAMTKQENGEPLSLDDMRILAEDEPLDQSVSQEEAAAEIAAALTGKDLDSQPIRAADPGDIMSFVRPTTTMAKDVVAPAGPLTAVIDDKMYHYPEEAHSSHNPDLPANGATTFDELDSYRDALHEARAIRDVTGDFEMLVGNVLAKSEPGELGDRIVSLGEEMKTRLENPPEEKSAQDSGFLSKIKEALQKAKITRASINDLPDSDFAYIEPGGKKDEDGRTVPRSLRHYPIHDAAHVRNALARASQQMNRGGKSAEIARKAMPKIKTAAKKMDIGAPAEGKSSGFRVEKALDGSWRWFGWVSNKFRDRDAPAEPKFGGQILSEAAHKEFVEWATADPKRMPELWPWHTKEGAHDLPADWMDYADGFLMMSGALTAKEAERVQQLAAKHDLAMSHGLINFDYDKKNGVIRKYRTFEASYLPREHAANEWTDIETLQKEIADMGFNPARRGFLVEALGEERVKKLESETEGRGKALEGLGVEYKALSDTLERLADDGGDEEEGAGAGDGPGDLKAVPTVDQIAAAVAQKLELKELSELLKDQSQTILAMGKALTALAKSDDEKVAEAMRPRADAKAFVPIWSKRLSQSEETKVDETKDKELTDTKPGPSKQSWITETFGPPQSEAAAIPR